jgi:hypothetical protein
MVVVAGTCGGRMSRAKKDKVSEVESRSCGSCRCIDTVLVMQGTLFWKDSRRQRPFLLEQYFFDSVPSFEHNFSFVTFDWEDRLLLAVTILISAGALHVEERPFLGTPTTYFERRANLPCSKMF